MFNCASRAITASTEISSNYNRLIIHTNVVLILSAVFIILQFAGCSPVEDEPPPLLLEDGVVIYNTHADIDAQNQFLDVTAELTFLADENTPSYAAFVLNGGLEVQNVTGPHVVSHQTGEFDFVPVWNVIEIELDETVAPGDTVSVTLEYSGYLDFDEDQFQYDGMFTSGWVDFNIDAMWHPIFAGFEQHMRGTMHLNLPEGWQAVGSGTTTFEDGTHIIRNEINLFDAPFAASPSFEIRQTDELEVYYRRADPEKVTAVFETGENCIMYLNHLFGAYDPITTTRLVIADRSGGGYARKNYIVISSGDIDPGAPVRLHRFICHELAHYWTPSPGGMSPDHWMSEAFAEFVAGRYLRDQFGEEVYNRELSKWENEGQGHGPVWTPELDVRPGTELMYRRAPFLLHRLEEKIGAERFDRFLTQYMTEDILYTTYLLDELEAIAGTEAAEWFRNELARDDW